MTEPPRHPQSNNVWKNGSFFLLASVVLLGTLVAASQFAPWYALAVVLIAAVLVLPMIGVLEALSAGTLSEKGFLQVILESYRRLPLLKGVTLPR